MKRDFEIKRLIIGLAELAFSDNSVHGKFLQTIYESLMKALVFLCQKSWILREKVAKKLAT